MKAATTDGVHAFLNDLSGVTSKSTIKVRITRLWDTWNVDKKKKGMISTDMVLMDEKVFLIALIKPLFIPKQLLCWPPDFNFFFSTITYMAQYQVGLQARSRMSCKKGRCMRLVFSESRKIREHI
jgi:hypothetical protein